MMENGVLVWFYNREDDTPIFYPLEATELAEFINFIDDLPRGNTFPLFIRIGEHILNTDEIEKMKIVYN
jgi:hypothetical protein